MAVARHLRAVGGYAIDVAHLADDPARDATSPVLRAHRARIRQLLEEARATLAATRRRGETGRGERLLVVLESADQVFLATLALSELLETRARGVWPEAERAAASALSDLAATLDAMARAVESEKRSAPIAVPSWDLDPLASPPSRRSVSPPSKREATEAEYAFAAELLTRVHAQIEEAAEIAATLEDERPTSPNVTTLDQLDEGSIFTPLRDHLTWRSIVLRHALRVGVTTAIAVWLTHVFALPRGYWITIAAAVILQPQLPATFSKATQRVLGTVLGGVLAACIAATVHDERSMFVIVFVLAVVSVSLMPINYGLYATFLTPVFVLIADMSTHTPGLVEVRIVNTLLGGALALLGARLLWPTSERELFPDAAAAVLHSVRAYVALAVSGAAPVAFYSARRRVGLALINAEASLQRWMAEVRHRAVDLEAPMAILVYARGLVAAAVALGSARDATSRAIDLAPFARDVCAVLDDLERAILLSRPPLPLPTFDRAIADLLAAVESIGDIPPSRRALLRTRTERVVQELAVAYDAVARWTSPTASPPFTREATEAPPA
jgi:uncharacterized membrane protein YccC